jgi:hypothetical protein
MTDGQSIEHSFCWPSLHIYIPSFQIRNSRVCERARCTISTMTFRVSAVELALRKPLAEQPPSCGLAVVLPDGRRIEVQRDFDLHTFERLMSALERV